MGQVSQTIDNLFDGVSRIPVIHRLAGQAEEQLNILSKFGLSRRPPMGHLKQIIDTTTGFEDSFFHEVRISKDERFVAGLINGDLRVFDVNTGEEATVMYPNGKSYLDVVTRGFRALTIGTVTYLVNRALTVHRGTERTDNWKHEALVYIRSVDYDTTFTVELNGTSNIATVTTPTSGRSALASDAIAASLVTALEATPVAGSFAFTRLGSAVHIQRNDGVDFDILVRDGLGDEAIKLVKRSVQRFTDLPPKAVEGFTVEVTGDESTKFDNYFVRYTEQDTPEGAGVWKEVAKPGTVVSLDPSTMPHVLEYGAPLESLEVEDFIEWQPAQTAVLLSGPVRAQIDLDFADAPAFPAGCSVTISCGGNIFDPTPTHVVTYTNSTGGDVTAHTVITALQPLLEAEFNITSSVLSTNVLRIEITGLDSGNFLVTIGMTPTTSIYDGSLSMTPSEHVGRLIQNLTDGSEGTITSNTAKSVVCSGGLSGGVFNEFQPGDTCQIVETGTYFVFKEAEWANRVVGDDTSSQFPSFLNNKVTELFEVESRLGFLSGPNVICSRAGDQLNFFRQTATQLLPDDPIDVRSALRGSPAFHSACNWNGGVLLFSDYAQFLLEGQPVYSPTTVSLKEVSAYQSLVDVHPVALGDSVFFASKKAGVPIIQELRVFGQAQTISAREVTSHIPNYIEGEPLALLGDDAKGVLFLRTDERDKLYVYVFQNSGDEKLQSSWSTWTLPGDLIGATLALGELQPVLKQSDGLYLNSLVLDADLNSPHLDRLCTLGTDGTTVDTSVSGFVTWTIPYSNAGVVVVNPDTFEVISTVAVSTNQLKHTIAEGDVTDYDTLGVFIGVPFSSSFEMSRLFVRDQNGKARPKGRTRISELRVRYFDSSDLSVRVSATGKADRVTTLNELDLEDGVLHVPVKAHNEQTTITLFTDTPGPFSVSAVDWEGESFPTGRSI